MDVDRDLGCTKSSAAWKEFEPLSTEQKSQIKPEEWKNYYSQLLTKSRTENNKKRSRSN